jgi:hypothetical protein
MTAEPVGGLMWSPNPLKQQFARYTVAYDLVDDRYEPVAGSAEELVLSKPFEIKLPIRDIAP